MNPSPYKRGSFNLNYHGETPDHAKAALAAGSAGMYWEMNELLFSGVILAVTWKYLESKLSREEDGMMSGTIADPFLTDLIPSLRAAGLVVSENPAIRPLSGGVSCDILLIEEGDRRIVVKRALEKLRVKDEWFADTVRDRYEQAYMRYANEIAPGSVPRILHADGERNFFAMEYLGDGWANWKTKLLAGRIEPRYARTAGETLAAIHRASWGDGTLRERFATTPNFFKLRIEPYLLTTGTRNPALEPHFKAEAERLVGASLALVHGDFSPKNIMLNTGSTRVAIIDCEVAWFGEPAFDIAFFLTHLLLKALHRPP